MLTFGVSRLIDLLSAIVIVTLGAKAVATAILLLIGKDARDRPGWGSWLWWLTKVTPIIAVPCAIAIALIEKRIDDALVFAAMAVFVAVAVPLKVRQRRARIASEAGIARQLRKPATCPFNHPGEGRGPVGER